MFNLAKISPSNTTLQPMFCSFQQTFIISANSNIRNLRWQEAGAIFSIMHVSVPAHILLNESKLKFWPVRLGLHNLHVNFDRLQNTVWKATIHLFNLLLLLIYIPFSTSLFSSWCQIYRSFYAVSVSGKSYACCKWQNKSIKGSNSCFSH